MSSALQIFIAACSATRLREAHSKVQSWSKRLGVMTALRMPGAACLQNFLALRTPDEIYLTPCIMSGHMEPAYMLTRLYGLHVLHNF